MNAWMPAEPPFDPNSFSGIGRLFPLPQVVSYPHVVTPLHVFEPRYRALTAEALQGDGLVTMAVLQPGWEDDYAGRPPLCPIGCLGKVLSHHQDSEGRYNLLLLGLKRVRLCEEVSPPLAFRRARVELIEERDPGADAERLKNQLIELMMQRVKPDHAAAELRSALTSDATLNSVTDLAAHSLPLGAESKVRLLAEADPSIRAQLILEQAPVVSEAAASFPPPFSSN